MMRFFQGEVKRIHQSVRQGGLGAECNGPWPKSPGLTFWPESVTFCPVPCRTRFSYITEKEPPYKNKKKSETQQSPKRSNLPKETSPNQKKPRKNSQTSQLNRAVQLI
ncbi:hypothetical protein AYR61_13660 [Secundilactobacillus paracollinoides]|uniref:Uncharacterized protein n=1 Tax=Secundilactobacillus paracollinoides TaxID=240427 RepID=A0A1B2J1U0_9LACO|nr:hypothetical protein AYR61_13660 [Secundilactobacillus paracollinoides]ANZ68220.1 hypothetical protein AYR63_14535 [Secundilactobacillus paracollinoides]